MLPSKRTLLQLPPPPPLPHSHPSNYRLGLRQRLVLAALVAVLAA